jgi:hypothetical protein
MKEITIKLKDIQIEDEVNPDIKGTNKPLKPINCSIYLISSDNKLLSGYFRLLELKSIFDPECLVILTQVHQTAENLFKEMKKTLPSFFPKEKSLVQRIKDEAQFNPGLGEK